MYCSKRLSLNTESPKQTEFQTNCCLSAKGRLFHATRAFTSALVVEVHVIVVIHSSINESMHIIIHTLFRHLKGRETGNIESTCTISAVINTSLKIITYREWRHFREKNTQDSSIGALLGWRVIPNIRVIVLFFHSTDPSISIYTSDIYTAPPKN